MEFSITPETCRICLKDSPRSKPLGDGYASGPAYNAAKEVLHSYLDVYTFVAGSEMDPAVDPTPLMARFFPTRICGDCEAQLTVAYEFRRKIIRSEIVLRNLLNLYGCSEQAAELVVEEECIVKEEEEECEVLEESTIEYKEYLLDESNEIEYQPSEPSNDQLEQLMESKRPRKRKDPTIEQLMYNEEEPTGSRSNSERVFKLKPSKSQCEDCGKVVSAKYLPYHRSTHQADGDRERPYVCELCDSRFTLRENLTKHKRIHANEKRYACPHCDEKFLHWASRRYHVQSRHTGEKKFTCEYCGTSFRHSSQYNIHIRRHVGAMPFGCEQCDRRFVSSYCLKMHLLTHTDAKNFQCDVCQKSYKSLKSLRIHKRTLHDLEKNYVCPLCSRAFSQNHVLRSHLIKHHPEYEPPPPGTVVSVKAIERLREQAELLPIAEPDSE